MSFKSSMKHVKRLLMELFESIKLAIIIVILVYSTISMLTFIAYLFMCLVYKSDSMHVVYTLPGVIIWIGLCLFVGKIDE